MSSCWMIIGENRWSVGICHVCYFFDVGYRAFRNQILIFPKMYILKLKLLTFFVHVFFVFSAMEKCKTRFYQDPNPVRAKDLDIVFS